MSLNIVGISAYYHNSACCLMQDGVLVCATEEERFTRIKHDPNLPLQSFRFCLEQGGITLADVDRITFYENPVKKLSRQIWTELQSQNAKKKKKMETLLLNQERVQREFQQILGYEGPIEFVEHH